MNKSKILIIGVAIVAFFIFFNPFGSLQNIQNKVAIPKVKEELVQRIINTINQNNQEPESFIIDAFKTHDIIFLGEFRRIKQQIEFAAELIPLLYANGIRDMGIEFALYEDQAAIDTLITEQYYNENWANKLLFNYLVIWGYQEYADFFKAAWKFNQSLSKGQAPFRIVGLSVKQNFKYITQMQDTENPEIMQKVYSRGLPDDYMADIIKNEFIAKNKKALIFAHMYTGFTRYKYNEFSDKMQKLGFNNARKAGQIIYEAIGPKVMNIMLHGPMPSDRNINGFDYPVRGALDAAIKTMPDKKWRTGFYTSQQPFNALVIDSEIFAKGYAALLLSDFCDAYIILNTLKEEQPVTQIPDFINDKNLEAAIENFIGIQNKKLSVKELNQFITDDLDGLKKVLKMFQ